MCTSLTPRRRIVHSQGFHDANESEVHLLTQCCPDNDLILNTSKTKEKITTSEGLRSNHKHPSTLMERWWKSWRT
ncbi:hypothetical protein ATANTOWER_004102 [Ataeniobius toweri]|uniref:Uncharacterized protein n=1 Tax=Ataeniobius toweri TaxID=208326 RepID=A0ABU7AAX8_9TELE|nr:hypothetical protein [Ataeniobius toweri]